MNSLRQEEELAMIDNGDIDIESKLNRLSLNPLNGLLYPYQQLLEMLCTHTRFIQNLIQWEIPGAALALSLSCLIISIILAVVAPILAWLAQWILRLVVWIFLGPLMAVADQCYFSKEADDAKQDESIQPTPKSVSAIQFDEHMQAARTMREDAIKLKDMRCHRFGRFINSTPIFGVYRFPDVPLPESYAVPYKPKFVKFVNTKRQKGSMLTGTMIHVEEKESRSSQVHNAAPAASDMPVPRAHSEEFDEDCLSLEIIGLKLKNVEGPFQKSDPFYEVYADSSEDGELTDIIYRSEFVANNLSPKWGPAQIDVNALCGGDRDKTFRIAVFDFEKDSKHEFMGSVVTTVNELMLSETSVGNLTDLRSIDTSKALILTKGSKQKACGKLVVSSVRVPHNLLQTGGTREVPSGVENNFDVATNESGLVQADVPTIPAQGILADEHHVENSGSDKGGPLGVKLASFKKEVKSALHVPSTVHHSGSIQATSSQVRPSSSSASHDFASEGKEVFMLHLIGVKLKNVEGPFKKSDPFYEVYAASAEDGELTDMIYCSEYIKNNLSPIWEPAKIDMAKLCGGDRDKLFRIAVFDYEKDLKHDFMGSIDTTVNGLIAANTDEEKSLTESSIDTSKALILTKGGKLIVSSIAMPASGANVKDCNEAAYGLQMGVEHTDPIDPKLDTSITSQLNAIANETIARDSNDVNTYNDKNPMVIPTKIKCNDEGVELIQQVDLMDANGSLSHQSNNQHSFDAGDKKNHDSIADVSESTNHVVYSSADKRDEHGDLVKHKSLRDKLGSFKKEVKSALHVPSTVHHSGSIQATSSQVRPSSSSASHDFASEGKEVFMLHLIGVKLKNVEGPFKKSDPFYEVYAASAEDGELTDMIYCSEYIKNNLSPIWEPAKIDMAKLCGGDRDKLFRIAVFDYEKDLKHDFMGSIDTTVNGLIAANTDEEKSLTESSIDTSKALILTKGSKHKASGKLIVCNVALP